jgi:hypothetical protein
MLITVFRGRSHMSVESSPNSHTWFKIRFNNIIFPSSPISPKWSIGLRLPHQSHVWISNFSHEFYIPRPSHSPRFVFLMSTTPWRRIGGVEIKLHAFLTSALNGGEWSAYSNNISLRVHIMKLLTIYVRKYVSHPDTFCLLSSNILLITSFWHTESHFKSITIHLLKVWGIETSH